MSSSNDPNQILIGIRLFFLTLMVFILSVFAVQAKILDHSTKDHSFVKSTFSNAGTQKFNLLILDNGIVSVSSYANNSESLTLRFADKNGVALSDFNEIYDGDGQINERYLEKGEYSILTTYRDKKKKLPVGYSVHSYFTKKDDVDLEGSLFSESSEVLLDFTSNREIELNGSLLLEDLDTDLYKIVIPSNGGVLTATKPFKQELLFNLFNEDRTLIYSQTINEDFPKRTNESTTQLFEIAVAEGVYFLELSSLVSSEYNVSLNFAPSSFNTKRNVDGVLIFNNAKKLDYGSIHDVFKTFNPRKNKSSRTVKVSGHYANSTGQIFLQGKNSKNIPISAVLNLEEVFATKDLGDTARSLLKASVTRSFGNSLQNKFAKKSRSRSSTSSTISKVSHKSTCSSSATFNMSGNNMFAGGAFSVGKVIFNEIDPEGVTKVYGNFYKLAHRESLKPCKKVNFKNKIARGRFLLKFYNTKNTSKPVTKPKEDLPLKEEIKRRFETLKNEDLSFETMLDQKIDYAFEEDSRVRTLDRISISGKDNLRLKSFSLNLYFSKNINELAEGTVIPIQSIFKDKDKDSGEFIIPKTTTSAMPSLWSKSNSSDISFIQFIPNTKSFQKEKMGSLTILENTDEKLTFKVNFAMSISRVNYFSKKKGGFVDMKFSRAYRLKSRFEVNK